MNSRTQRFIECILNDALEDYFILKQLPFKKTVSVFYEEKGDKKLFVDYEQTAYDLEEYRQLLPEEEKEAYEEAIARQNSQGITKAFNTIYDDEKVEIMSYEDFIWLLVCLLNQSKSLETKVVIYYLNLKGITPYKLAQLLKITKQRLSNYMNDLRKWPTEILEQISKILNFDISEYFKEVREEYIAE